MTLPPGLVAVVVIAATVATLSSPGAQPVAGSNPPVVTPSQAPPGLERLPVTWVDVAAPGLGRMRAAIARPPGPGPHPAVVILHGTHGFARQYVEWASALAQAGFIAVAGCWFSGAGGAGVRDVTPIPCPDLPPLASGEFPQAVPLVDALVQATRALPGTRGDRLALVGHSRGGGATQQYLLAGGKVRAAVLHASGYGLEPWNRAPAFEVPILIMHGTADAFSRNTAVDLARRFETSLRASGRQVETAYCEGCGHNTFFTDPAQRDGEVAAMAAFLRRHLAR